MSITKRSGISSGVEYTGEFEFSLAGSIVVGQCFSCSCSIHIVRVDPNIDCTAWIRPAVAVVYRHDKVAGLKVGRSKGACQRKNRTGMAAVGTTFNHLSANQTGISAEDFEVQVGVTVYVTCRTESVTKQVGVSCCRIHHAANVSAYIDDVILLGNTGNAEAPGLGVGCILVASAGEYGRIVLSTCAVVIATCNCVQELNRGARGETERNRHALDKRDVVVAACIQCIDKCSGGIVKCNYAPVYAWVARVSNKPIVEIGRGTNRSINLEAADCSGRGASGNRTALCL